MSISTTSELKRINSMSEFLDEYFPKRREQEAKQHKSAEEIGELLAQNSLAKFEVPLRKASKRIARSKA